MNTVAELLYTSLEYIGISSGPIRAKGMNHEIIDGVMHFFLDYDFHVLRQTGEATKMQSMEKEAQIKDGGQ
jgi:hypothetical protein